MKAKVVFADTTHPVLPQLLTEQGFECVHFYESDTNKLKLLLKDAFGLIIRSRFPIDEALLEIAPQLKFIGRVGAGMENIDIAAAQARQIKLFNAPEGNRDAVAEHSLGMLLALNNRLLIVDAEVRNGIWKREENRGVEIHGKTIGIIGFGNMGEAFSKRLQGFGAKIMAYDKYKFGFGNDFVEEVSMDQLFEQADIVSLHIPQTVETKGLVRMEWLSRFKKPIVLINTSRGKIVKSSDLLDAISNGLVSGACLDVLEYESSSFEKLFAGDMPETFRQLINCKKVILSPHIAGWTLESNIKLATVLAEKIGANFKQ